MKRVVFFGAKDIGYDIFSRMLKWSRKLDFEIIGVLTNHRGHRLADLAKKNGFLLLKSLRDYLELSDIDICICVQYHEILKQQHINKANDVTINLHMAPVPEYRGCNQFSFAIVDKVKEFGSTLHLIDTTIDGGDVLAEKRFPIRDDITVSELYEETYHASCVLFEENIEAIINGTYSLVSQEELGRFRTKSFHTRKEIYDLKQIDLKWDPEKIQRYVRATLMPGFEPPYYTLNNELCCFDKVPNIDEIMDLKSLCI